MGYRKIRVCDNCGDELVEKRNTYHIDKIVLASERFTDAAGDRDTNVKGIELCEKCADRVVDSLEKIASHN